MIETMIALMMVYANNTNFLPTPTEKGDRYFAHQTEYFPAENKTCTVWNRYYVWGEKYGNFGSFNKTILGLQVWCYPGKVSVDEIRKDGRNRADALIVVE